MNLKKSIDWNEYHLKHDVGNREKVREVYARTLRYRNVTIPRVQARS